MFLNNWGEGTTDLLQRYSRQTPNNSGIWKDVKGTLDAKAADYYILLDGLGHHDTSLPIEKTIFVKREPDFISRYRTNYIHSIDWTDTNCGITWWINKTYDELKSIPYPDKSKDISCIVSSKHGHRNRYVQSLFSSESPIDLYGRIHNSELFGDNYKGILNYNGNCKFKGLIDYRYSIVLENSRQLNYWTEKLADAYIAWCVPLYWGCPNIEDYFPKNSYYSLDINNLNQLNDIKDIITQPVDVDALTKSRNLVLDNYNIWEVIHNKIISIESQ